ncbi:TonB-dependent receptor family protein [Novosphingobium mangrovi (ex Huang et al. 2023)]|uniref:TonB-dependent receptor n=1 Tax=Novosphingobium mangrovi (ex Huang et al. 2023) TaxID=2976432 RepID=A0ABT2I3B4_9SPHN|nr:TonB-dependent receptor [Novosphingobium mangrovi (ex Huang et al. 2023)]MCT2399288.1 TonB-dependent receptor [Novosphingobium mangrovi (ex Huang et al. 2023)]
MKVQLRRSTALSSLLVSVMAWSSGALASDTGMEDAAPANEAILVSASKPQALEVGGSVQFLDSEDLAEFSYTDPNRLLRQIPGVNLQEEDGFGLRPNIGIRGSGTDRSARIALMEDGVLIAPAPYAAPSAYYFPQISRMSAVEVSKGPAAIKYGPMTVGGALNLISTPIPDETSGFGELLAGSYAARRGHGWAGGWVPLSDGLEAGGLIEGLYEHSGGFKHIDAGGDTGFEITDVVAKLGLRSTDGRHALEFKFEGYDETSAETYLGLTLDDFRATPYRRYNASQRDEMNADHQTYQLTYRFRPSDALGFTVVAYRNDTKRAWYKLNDVRNTADTGWNSISSVVADPVTYATQMADLVGAPGYTGRTNGLRVRNNNRRYQATGVQGLFEARFATGSASHELQLSARYHEDEEDRFQQDDVYQMADGRMILTSAGAPGSNSNRLGEAEAWAFFIQDTITLGTITLTPGLRYETIDLKRTDWSGSDPERVSPTSIRTTNVDVWIPGVAAAWEFSPGMRFIAGAHRGFASPGPGSTTDAETSWNYEAGFKLARNAWHLEAIGFFNDYANLVGTCTNSTGGNCTIGDQFDGGAAHVKGLELTGGYTFGSIAAQGFAVPVSVVYTLTDAEFRTSFESDYEPWGTVEKGDLLPYLPKHQLTLNAGVDLEKVRLSASVNLVSKARAVAGTGTIPASQKIDGRALVDLAAEWDVYGPISLFGTVNNLFDKTYNVAFSPAGARPGAPRMVLGGIRARF